jgi:hypothetical protein
MHCPTPTAAAISAERRSSAPSGIPSIASAWLESVGWAGTGLNV